MAPLRAGLFNGFSDNHYLPVVLDLLSAIPALSFLLLPTHRRRSRGNLHFNLETIFVKKNVGVLQKIFGSGLYFYLVQHLWTVFFCLYEYC